MFSSTGKKNLKFSTSQMGFVKLWKGLHFLERRVQETNVDVEKNTGFLISNCRIFYEDDDSFEDEFLLEIFSFKDGKISKYRASFAVQTTAHDEDPLKHSLKDKALAKVRELNYSWAGEHPDLGKIASYFDENTEFKVWSWDNHKNFVFNKKDFVTGYLALQDNFVIKCVVPYEMFFCKMFTVATYVFHLEKKTTGEKLVWINTISYGFSQDLKIKQVRQQGEIYPETKGIIPFEPYEREKIVQKVHEFYENLKPNLDIFYNNIVDCECRVCKFGPKEFPLTGSLQGLKSIENLITNHKSMGINHEWKKVVDIYVDSQDSGYEAAFVVTCGQGSVNIEGFEHSDKRLNLICVLKLMLENTKLVKMYQFITVVHQPIPSPFDEKGIVGVNIYQRKKGEEC